MLPTKELVICHVPLPQLRIKVGVMIKLCSELKRAFHQVIHWVNEIHPVKEDYTKV